MEKGVEDLPRDGRDVGQGRRREPRRQRGRALELPAEVPDRAPAHDRPRSSSHLAQDAPAKILGLLLDERLGLPDVKPTEEKQHLADKLKAYQSLSHVLNAMSGAGDQEAIEDSKRAEIVALGIGSESPVCRIPVKGYEILDFDMDQGRVDNLIKSGRTTMESYLSHLA